MSDKDEAKADFRAKVQEMKKGIGGMLGPHELPGWGGVITVVLLELGIERHLRVCSTEKSVRALLRWLIKNVLDGKKA